MITKKEIAVTLVIFMVNALLIGPAGYVVIKALEDYDEFKMYVIRQLEEADGERKQLSERINTEQVKSEARAAAVTILTSLVMKREERQE